MSDRAEEGETGVNSRENGLWAERRGWCDGGMTGLFLSYTEEGRKGAGLCRKCKYERGFRQGEGELWREGFRSLFPEESYCHMFFRASRDGNFCVSTSLKPLFSADDVKYYVQKKFAGMIYCSIFVVRY